MTEYLPNMQSQNYLSHYQITQILLLSMTFLCLSVHHIFLCLISRYWYWHQTARIKGSMPLFSRVWQWIKKNMRPVDDFSWLRSVFQFPPQGFILTFFLQLFQKEYTSGTGFLHARCHSRDYHPTNSIKASGLASSFVSLHSCEGLHSLYTGSPVPKPSLDCY